MKQHLKNEGFAVQMILDAARERGGNADILAKLQFELWKKQYKSGEDIFVLLQIDEEGDKIVKIPLLITWVSYLAYLGKGPDIFFINLAMKP
ncbi:hypothetical protein PsorP6_015580 [Peronosclerospora sorghi]|uniref:Uncharacterized protein n=1 Tax=Peronosclerospora sorghi TaxID=230839 RepID=A0ACC0WN75_9STRA|nr:hypothetical protein PsorP6_015580 [Peronosclerospora sorghi]